MLLAVLAVGATAVLPTPAFASEILTRNAKYISIKVGDSGKAVVSYKQNGKWKHPLIWGAINARPPSKTVDQVSFKIDYSGGWGTVPQADLEDDEEPLPAVRRPDAPVAW